MRQFIRHPVDMPVEIRSGELEPASAVHTHDISLGGLALLASAPLPVGACVAVRIAQVQPPFEAHVRVAWCHALDAEFELGVTFLDAQDAFAARMVEQVCHIDEYRKSVQCLEGRELDAEEAAAEWIARHAADFPDIGSHATH